MGAGGSQTERSPYLLSLVEIVIMAIAQFDFSNQSPINQQFYAYKAVKSIFTDAPEKIVVVTVNVYYFN